MWERLEGGEFKKMWERGRVRGFFFFYWDSPHARLNSHYEAWSYKKKSTKKITGYRLRWIRWEGDEVGRWEIFDFIQGWEMQSESKISPFFMLIVGTKRGRIGSRIFAWPTVLSL